MHALIQIYWTLACLVQKLWWSIVWGRLMIGFAMCYRQLTAQVQHQCKSIETLSHEHFAYRLLAHAIGLDVDWAQQHRYQIRLVKCEGNANRTEQRIKLYQITWPLKPSHEIFDPLSFMSSWRILSVISIVIFWHFLKCRVEVQVSVGLLKCNWSRDLTPIFPWVLTTNVLQLSMPLTYHYSMSIHHLSIRNP